VNVVFDTNVYISALVFPGGICDQIFRIIRNDRIKLFVSPDILTGLKKILTDKFKLSEEDVENAISRVLAIAQLTYPRFRIGKIKSPDADNRILECAVEAKASFLVTGDKKHILPLKRFNDIHIVSPSQFLNIIERIEILK
jgi:putative PIN family toxin of toxin-antitoxin system